MRMTEEQRNEFINKNMGIIGDIATKPFKKGGNYKILAESYGYQYEDVVNTGVLGMIEGIEKYEIEKATKEDGGVVPLEAWVRNHVKKHMSQFIGKPKNGDKHENRVSMDKKVYNNDGSHTTVGDMMAEEQHVENWGGSMDHNALNELLSSDLLSDTEVIAIDARFVKGYKFREVDELLQNFLNNDTAKGFYFLFIL